MALTEDYDMEKSRTGLLVAAAALLALGGCQSERFQPLYSRPLASAPAPLTPAPTDPVEQQQLPPPGQTAEGEFPEAPGADGTQVASAEPPAGAGDITKSSLVGNWKTNASGSTCQMFLTLTKYGNASRGGTRGCPGELANMRGWDVQGKQLIVYDDSGNTIARLYSSGGEKLDGQTVSGQAVSLYR